MKKVLILASLALLLAMTGCAWEAVSRVPDKSDIYMTTGDLKDGGYTPLGMVSAMRFDLAFSCLGVLPPLFPMFGPRVQDALYEQIAKEAKKIGANAVINISTMATPTPLIPGLIWIPVVVVNGMAVKM